MINRDTPVRRDRSITEKTLAKSIFPIFHVNVPMPRDTAVPGSYRKPVEQSSSGMEASEPVTDGQ